MRAEFLDVTRGKCIHCGIITEDIEKYSCAHCEGLISALMELSPKCFHSIYKSATLSRFYGEKC